MSSKINVPARVFTLFASELVILFGCFLAGAYTDSNIDSVPLFLLYDSGFIRIGIAVAFLVTGLFFRDLYADVRIRNRLALFQELCLIFGLAFIGQGVISYLDRNWIVPRRMMLPGSLFGFVAVFGWRLILDSAARSALTSGRVLFLGMSPTVARIAGHFEAHPESGMVTVGYLESGSGVAPARVARLGTMADLDGVLDKETPDSIVIGRREDIQPWWADEFLALRFGGIRVEEAGTLYERVFARKSVRDLWPQRLIFRETPGTGSSDMGLQSACSWIIALVLAAITLPLTLTIAALIRIGSQGPILVRETRTGLRDEPFGAYRFRCVGREGEYTAIGRFLRRHGLVWLPQLLNVLKGEMAMVGPRPERPLFARRMNELIPFYRQRHFVKPGMTGWARIHRERGEEQDSLQDLEYDLYYLENHATLLDLFILLLSLKTVVGIRRSAV